MHADYIRVTDVLNPFSGLQFVKPKILEEACRRGQHVHEASDIILKENGKIIRTSLGIAIKKKEDYFLVDPKYEKYVESLCQWISGKRFIDKPERFYCDKYKITGECDAICEEENGLVLVDFKTSANESKTWKLQGSAYSYLAKKKGYPITGIVFVRLNKDGSYPQILNYEEDFDTFLSCLDVYNYFYKNKKNNIDCEDL